MPAYPDDDFFIYDPADPTKLARFDIGTLTTATLRSFALPNDNGTIACLEIGNTWTGDQDFRTSCRFRSAIDVNKQITFNVAGAATPSAITLTSVATDLIAVTFPDANCRLVGAVFTQTSDKSVTNTTTETTIFGTGVGSLTLGANSITAGKTIRLTMSGVYSTVAVTGDIITVKVKLGSTVIATKATTALVTGGTNLYWSSTVLITCRTTGASGTVMVSGGISYQIAGAVTVTDELNNAAATTTVDTTASKVIDVTVTHSAANASNTVKSLVSAVEILN